MSHGLSDAYNEIFITTVCQNSNFRTFRNVAARSKEIKISQNAETCRLTNYFYYRNHVWLFNVNAKISFLSKNEVKNLMLFLFYLFMDISIN